MTFTATSGCDDAGSQPAHQRRYRHPRLHRCRFLLTTGDRICPLTNSSAVLGGEKFFRPASGSAPATSPSPLTNLWNAGPPGNAPAARHAPVYERYYAGGIGSIRGFSSAGVSPRQGLDDDLRSAATS
ncbi:MAG: BamA/TamA family outer membrane protein [Phycisphaerales bacterium]|nr:BamA/TamA family outer membrane protein [Phycisphaerales bacterium]